MNPDREITRSFQTIVEMVQDRRLYASVNELTHFRDYKLPLMGSALESAVFAFDFPTCELRIVYNMHPKFKVSDVKKLLEFAGTVILVTKDAPKTVALKGLEGARAASSSSPATAITTDAAPNASLSESSQVQAQTPTTTGAAPQKAERGGGSHIQVFDIKELLSNKSRHEYQPLHIPIRDEKKIKEIMDSFKLKSKSQFKQILSTDPMARYLALHPGELAMIIRPSPSAGLAVDYRCCSSARG